MSSAGSSTAGSAAGGRHLVDHDPGLAGALDRRLVGHHGCTARLDGSVVVGHGAHHERCADDRHERGHDDRRATGGAGAAGCRGGGCGEGGHDASCRGAPAAAAPAGRVRRLPQTTEMVECRQCYGMMTKTHRDIGHTGRGRSYFERRRPCRPRKPGCQCTEVRENLDVVPGVETHGRDLRARARFGRAR